MKKNIGAQLALYPAPVIVVGAIVNDKPTWTLVAHAGTMAHSHLMVSLVHAHYINQEIIESTDCCLTQKGSGIVVMQEQLNQNECQILIYSVQDFLARHSLSPESEKDLLTQEELSFLKLPGFLKLKDHRILSLKMFPVCYRMTKAGRFAPSSVRFLNWGTMSNGKCLTARISESPKQESGCILSDILISDVPEKYYLNQKQMEQLLFKSGQEVREKESTVPKD